MKKIKIITFFSIFLITLFLINFDKSYATQDIKYMLCVDTKLEGQTFDKNGIQIEGWKLATEPNTKLEIKIDGEPVEFTEQDMLLYDLISIIQGYGTYEENPVPNYKINIPTTDIPDGNHKLQIEFVTENGILLERYERNIIIDKSIKHMLCVDTKLEGQIFDKNGIQIEGWKLATEPNTKLEIKIDGEAVEFTEQDMLLYDLISIIQGYGTYEENPAPNYKINIPTADISNGNHKLQIEFVTENGILLERYERNIIIDKLPKHMLCVDTNLEGQTLGKNGIQIEGWKLATEPNTKLEIKIDGEEVEFTEQDMLLYDLISIIQGYGTYEENPAPNYKINIPTTNIEDGKHQIQIDFVTENGTLLERYERNIIIDKLPKHMLCVDTELEGQSFDKYGIQIEGWKLAEEPNTKLEIELNGIPVEFTEEDKLLYDLISIIQGYGTYEENPTPNYKINIPTKNIQDGSYKLTIKFVTENGIILETYERNIIIDKSIKHMLQIDTDLSNIIFNENKNIRISGWKLATEANANLRILIDGQEVSSNYIKYSLKYDLISIVKGYGTYEENPQPNFDINIPTVQFTKQSHIITIQHMDPNGTTVLQSVEFVANYGEKYDGIDVSSYNTVTDWNSVAQSGIDYVMVRIGYRGYRTPRIVLDSKAIQNIRGAKAAGLKVGIYFFSQAINEQEAQEEALWVIEQIKQYGIQLDYPIAIDTEDTGATGRGEAPGRADTIDKDTRTKVCKTFMDVIQANGYTPMIYANKYWYQTKLNFSEISNYEIWLAHYTHNESIRSDFTENYNMWQYTDKGTIQGITGVVDLNACYKKY